MKKKKGFTLAEVLITLGIIGVVAALAAPILGNNIQKSKVAPSLRKFISTMENANEHILAANEDDKLSGIVKSESEYIAQLRKYVKGNSIAQGIPFYKYDGTETYNTSAEYIFKFASDDSTIISFTTPDPSKLRNSDTYKGIIAYLVYDMNGFENKPNKVGKDIFEFCMDDTGAVIPMGGSAEYAAYTTVTTQHGWEGTCDATKVTDGWTCAGSIADNNWKIIYKY